MAAAGTLVRALSAALLLGLGSAQCTLPAALPADTAFAAGNPAECELGGELDGAGQGPCVIECVAGNAQGAGGYEYVCTGADMPDPTPDCTPCPENTFGETPGLVTCTDCPANSGTDGVEGADAAGSCLCDAGFSGTLPDDACEECAVDTYNEASGAAACTDCTDNAVTDGVTGATAVTACLCAAGYEGEIATAADACTACELGSYLGEVGEGPCTDCTENAVTADVASTAITDCLCAAGHSGDPQAPEDTCDACEEATYKEGTGTGACLDCPADSTTEEEGATAVTLCLCEAGFTNEITGPTDNCATCAVDTWKTELGPEDCTSCPENSNTNGADGSPSYTACICDADNGWEGEIGSPADICRQPTSVTPGAVVGISAAAVVGVAAALGGVMYGKGAYSVQSNADLGIERRGRTPSGDGERTDPLLGSA